MGLTEPSVLEMLQPIVWDGRYTRSSTTWKLHIKVFSTSLRLTPLIPTTLGGVTKLNGFAKHLDSLRIIEMNLQNRLSLTPGKPSQKK